MYTRPIYILFSLLATVAVALWINSTVYPFWLEANATPLAQINAEKKAKALHRSIQHALLANNEHVAGYTSTPCVSQIEMTPDESIDDADISVDDGAYYCTVTAQSGAVYDAEITLLVVNGELWETPALLTPIDPRELETSL